MRRALLYGAGAVTGWTLSGGGCSELLLRPGAEPLDPPLVEERSNYTEEVIAGEVPAVRHTLRLVLSGWQGRKLADEAFLRRAATEGVAAVIETESGERFVAGRSLRLGGEQPLRLESSSHTTGSRRTEAPETVLVLRCTDDAPALNFNLETR